MGKRPPAPSETSAQAVLLPPLTLEDCYALALKQSETVAIQKEEIEDAEAQFFNATSEALGDIDFVMERRRLDIQKGGGDSSSVGSSFTDPDRRERKFVITQPLFQGFKALGALTGAGSLKREQKEEWLRAQELLFFDVVSAFYGLLRERKNLETAEGIYSLFQERIKELTAREQIGRSRASELVTAQARMKTLEAERAGLRGTAAVAQSLLEFLTGIELKGRELREEAVPETVPQELSSYLEAAEARSDVEAAKQSMKSAWGGVIVAQSEFWPELSLEHTQYERREGFQSNIDWEFLFKINVPLFRGGESLGGLKEAVSLWKREKLAFSLARREAELDIKKSYQEWTAAVEESRALEEAVKASEENFRLQREEYTRNLVNNLEVLEALELFHETRREANQAHYQMKENYWRLKVATGEVL